MNILRCNYTKFKVNRLLIKILAKQVHWNTQQVNTQKHVLVK